MAEATTTVTIRLPKELKNKLDRLSKATDRSKSRLAAAAIEEYLDVNEWQIKEIKAGIKEADKGDFAYDKEVAAVIAKWTQLAS